MTPIFFDAHTCSLPSTAELIGREMDFECGSGRRWFLAVQNAGRPDNPSWILEAT